MKLICDKTPDQIKLDYALWTRKAVMELIKQEIDIDMPIRTVGEYLKRWGFTPQQPMKRVCAMTANMNGVMPRKAKHLWYSSMPTEHRPT